MRFVELRCGSRIFLTGGGGKTLENLVYFFLGRTNYFELSQITIKTLFRPNFLKVLEKTPKIAFFSARAPPSKLVYIGGKYAFRKKLGPASQRLISQNSTKGGLFESAEGRILEGG